MIFRLQFLFLIKQMIYLQYIKIMFCRQDVIDYIKEKYNVEPEYLWPKYPDYCAFRNPETKKRFVCWIANIWKKFVNAWEEWTIDVIDVKSDPNMIEYLRTQPWLRPWYHMNKKHWLTILLWPMSPKEDLIKSLIDISYKYSCKDRKKLLWLSK